MKRALTRQYFGSLLWQRKPCLAFPRIYRSIPGDYEFLKTAQLDELETGIAVPGSVKYRLIFESLIQQGFCRGLLYLTRQRTAIVF